MSLVSNVSPIPMYRFPAWPVQATGSVSSAASPLLDVQYGSDLVSASTRSSLQRELEILGEKRRDSPAPKYHNIIDPNIGNVNGTWVPTEFQVSEAPFEETVAVLERAWEKGTNGMSLPEGFLEKAMSHNDPPFVRAGKVEIRSHIPDLDPHDNAQLYLAIENVFEAALPLLAKMKLPALLLPGPLQVVVKAQRIVLKASQTYSGVWHEDGVREHVIAVVLYYYRVSRTLKGGDMEIAAKDRTCVLGVGDNIDFPMLSERAARQGIGEIPRCKVPISEGTLLVFSNYAAVHRVLPMRAVGGLGSRDFLAFFVIDQREPLPLPRELGPLAHRKKLRGSLLREQLQSRGRFALDDSYSY